ncbi:MAG: hypothetical protein K0Q91_343 [Fibrobacteria bacterium]|jgi:uncharacterized protein (DUF1697 family)|nr:hypothetical protein [Fibrobacteria bacterium]
MPRYVALLRGVSPMNLRMPDLKKALEAAGFTNVKTLLSSGNAAFDSRKASEVGLQKKIEQALTRELGKHFLAIVRAQEDLQALLEAEPYAKFSLPKGSKKVVTFLLRESPAKLKLPIVLDNARILAMDGHEVFSVYVPDPKKGPVFMSLLEKTYGKDITTRTWDTVRKCAAA